jgi:hypothetical protein
VFIARLEWSARFASIVHDVFLLLKMRAPSAVELQLPTGSTERVHKIIYGETNPQGTKVGKNSDFQIECLSGGSANISRLCSGHSVELNSFL